MSKIGKYETHAIADVFPMMTEDEQGSLVRSMRDVGYDESKPVVLFEGKILDGRNRYRAALEAEVKPHFREWTGGNPWNFVRHENADRRHLEPSTRVACVLTLVRGSEAWEGERASAREAANVARSEGVRATQAVAGVKGFQPKPSVRLSGDKPTLENPPPSPRAPKTQHEHVRLAQAAGVSPATASRVLSLEKKSPEAFARVARGEVSAQKALGEVKLEAKRALAEEIRANPIVTPDGRYQVIVSDPPWKYDTRAEDTSHRGKNQYPDMTTEEICALPVGALAQDDCLLWLWTTNAFMRDAYRCLDAWGFREKTILTWDKELLGLGDWLRNVTEHCILAVKGKPVVALTNQTTIIREKRREHSRKPVAFYSMVEALCPGSKLEMFSRSPRDGWGVWGAETEKFNAAE